MGGGGEVGRGGGHLALSAYLLGWVSMGVGVVFVWSARWR